MIIKSSAASISFPGGTSGRDAKPILPSGDPVEKENGVLAIAGDAAIPAAKRTIKTSFFIGVGVLMTGESPGNSLPYSPLEMVFY